MTYKDFELFLNGLQNRPKLLLHACCGPCSTSVLELLNNYFKVDIYYYNPNIYPEEEYLLRKDNLKRVLDNQQSDSVLIEGSYDVDLYNEVITGLEDAPEGGSRCYKCIKLRMEKSAIYARDHGYDYFTTTLSVSPHKNSKMINEIGYELEKKYNISYLYSDFKKREGYKRSVFLAKKYDLYRQDYCGCKYSKNKLKKVNNE